MTASQLEREEERDREEKEKLLEGGQAGCGSAKSDTAALRRAKYTYVVVLANSLYFYCKSTYLYKSSRDF